MTSIGLKIMASLIMPGTLAKVPGNQKVLSHLEKTKVDGSR